MKVSILTNFGEFVSGYSLTGIVQDQARMLKKYGHDVSVFVLDSFSGEPLPEDLSGGENPVKLVKAMPFGHLKDYRSESELTEYSKELSDKVAAMMEKHLVPDKCDIAFTHDFIFTGWNLPHSLAIRKVTLKLPHMRWLHWVHSVPSTGNDWWYIRRYGRNHRIIFPNRTERIRVAEQFRGTVEDVRAIPHIKDIRSFFDFDWETREFIDTYPGVMRADIVQVYPASTDRLSAKRLDMVLAIFGHMKSMGRTVCLVCANQWATGKQRKESCSKFEALARDHGLVVGEEFIFTSRWKGGEFDTGLPREILRELMMLGNLFIFPTSEESFGLVVPEIVLAGAPLMVVNKSLDMMAEVNGGNGLYVDFSSHHRTYEPPLPWPEYMGQIARLIVSRMQETDSLRHRSFVRQQYNMDNIYQKFYEPIMTEAVRGWLP